MTTLPVPSPAPQAIPDAVLVHRMARRDATALIELERRYGSSLYALVYGILMDPERAERLVSDVFEQVWQAAELLNRRHRGAYPWLRQAARERAWANRATPESQ